MITNNDLEQIQLSATKKDFYQIWNELLDVTTKLTKRWDPTATLEDDPGIVIYKALTGVADKLNYLVDVNTLEAFMPSAAQRTSMENLTRSLGYNMKYYRSAETTATIIFNGNATDSEGNNKLNAVLIPRFTVLTNGDNTITYITKENVVIKANQLADGTYTDNLTGLVPVIEGQLAQVQTSSQNLITINQLDDNNRFYLPETQIAENGIFIRNVTLNETSTTKDGDWIWVDNLNTRGMSEKVYVFRYDSDKNLPYLQFPDDIESLIGDGLEIYYIRTTGLGGNIVANTLNTMVIPSNFASDYEGYTDILDVGMYQITNKDAATSGSNLESLNDAYTNFNKTVGTFDTLVTCRDYMNKIYSMLDEYGVPLISQVKVTDTRDDINDVAVISTIDEFGCSYKYNLTKNAKISNFDLKIYPFKKVYSSTDGSVSRDNYHASFSLSTENSHLIEEQLASCKTISHNIVYPKGDELAYVKILSNLSANIVTTYKVGTVEQKLIIEAIKAAIYKTFNMRNMEWGEDIPIDTIYDTILNADYRIKSVFLEDPKKTVTYVRADGTVISSTDEGYEKLAQTLVAKNILAGKYDWFNYDENFEPNLLESNPGYENSGGAIDILPMNDNEIKSVSCKVNITDEDLKNGIASILNEGEIVQLRHRSYESTKTYANYVNYNFKLSGGEGNKGVGANMKSLKALLDGDATEETRKENYEGFVNNEKIITGINTTCLAEESYPATTIGKGYPVFYFNTTGKSLIAVFDKSKLKTGTKYYTLNPTKDNFNHIVERAITKYEGNLSADTKLSSYAGIYAYVKTMSYGTYTPGILISESGVKYKKITVFENYVLSQMYIPNPDSKAESNYGIGVDPSATIYIPANTTYTLGSGDKLYVQYNTKDETSGTETEVTEINGTGTIIRPSFDLYDSGYSNSALGKSFTKNNVQFKSGDTSEKVNLYTLSGANQIELVEPAEVALKNANIKAYWITNDINSLTGDVELKFDNNGIKFLEDGEYFFYTDNNELDLAWYGPGTKITYKDAIGRALKISKKNIVSVGSILSLGMQALKGKWYNIATTGNDGIVFSEYEYRSIVAGDKIKSCTIEVGGLTKAWTILPSPSSENGSVMEYYEDYKNNTTTPTIIKSVDTKDTWEVRTKYLFDVSPTKRQLLTLISSAGNKQRNVLTATYTNDNTVTLDGNNKNEVKSMYFKTNKEIYSSLDVVNCGSLYNIEDSDETETKYDLKLKLIKYEEQNEAKTSGSNAELPISLYEFDEYNRLSMVRFNSITDSDLTYIHRYVRLNTNIAEGQFGILTLFFCSPLGEQKDYPYLKPSSGSNLYLYQNNSWWEGYHEDDDKYILPPKDYEIKEANKICSGISTVLIPYNCKYIDICIDVNTETISENDLTRKVENEKQSVIFSDIDIINTNYTGDIFGINPRLLKSTDLKKESTDLFNILNTLDYKWQFFYNNMTKDGLILSDLEIEGEDIQRLDSPETYLDKNNLHNKFTMVEINPSTLSAGIRISANSRK